MDSPFAKTLWCVLLALVIALAVPLLLLTNLLRDSASTRKGVCAGMVCLFATAVCNVISGDMIMVIDLLFSSYWIYFTCSWAQEIDSYQLFDVQLAVDKH
jgi:hypothetical protein